MLLLSARSRRARALLFAFGLLAAALHSLAGVGLIHSHTTTVNGRFVADICTTAGFAKTNGDRSQPNHGSLHDCCNLCAVSGPLLLTDAAVAVPPAPTFTISALIPASAHPASFAWAAHSPRGPPRRA